MRLTGWATSMADTDLRPAMPTRVWYTGRMKLTSIFLSAALLASCGGPACLPQPQQHFDDDTGLEGFPTTEGSLAGTWGLVVEFALILQIAIVGDKNGG